MLRIVVEVVVVVVVAAAAVVVAGAAGASHIYNSTHIKNGLSGFKSTTMRSSCSIFLAWMIRRLVARRPQPQSLDYMHSQTRYDTDPTSSKT